MISGASTARVFFPLLVEEVLMLLFKEADTFYVNCKKLEQILATLSLKYNTLFFFHFRFVPFTHRERPYDPLLHTTSQYGR